MRHRFATSLGVMLLAVALCGCVAIPARTRAEAQVGSAVIGGLAGYALTENPAGVVVGALTGMIVGNELQRYVDATDQQRVYGVTHRGILLPHGRYHEDIWIRGEWRYHSRIDPDDYYIERTYRCRRFTQVTHVYSARTGRLIGTRTHRGTACFDGHRWYIRD